MTHRAPIGLALLLPLCLFACDGAGEGDLSADAVADVADASPDAQPDTAPDAGPDTAPDAGPEVLAVPYVPAPPAEPWVDRPYVQEINHTTPEVPPGVGALVAALPAGPAWTAYAPAVLVSPRGLLRAGPDGVHAPVPIDAGAADLLGAEAAGGAVWGFNADGAWRWLPTGEAVAVAAPDGVELTGAVAAGDVVWLMTSAGLARAGADGQVMWASGAAPVTAVASGLARTWVAGPAGLSAFAPGADVATATPLLTLGPADGLTAAPIVALVADLAIPEPLDLVVVTAAGLQAVAVAEGAATLVDVPVFADGRVPLPGARHAVPTADGGLLIATPGGAIRLVERGFGPEWRVYGAERWAPSEDVRRVAAEADGTLHFATAAGPGRVTAETVTLEDKLEPFVQRVLDRHDRHGAVADSHLTVRGDVASNIPWDSDNDGTWTSFWLVAECFRYKVTGDPAAKANFDRSLDAMLSLRDLTGTDWFVARAVIEKATCNLDDCDDPDDGEWFTSPDGKWWVKGDTSNDELAAHLFMMGPAYDLCADEGQKARIVDHMDGIVGGLIDHDWLLLDVDGKVTTYGQWDPAYVNGTFAGIFGDGGVRSVEILAALTLTHYLTGDPRYLEAKAELMELHDYDDNAIREKHYSEIRLREGSNDEMAVFSWYGLLRYEQDPALRARWLEGWANTYGEMRQHQGAWWNVIEAAVGGGDWDPELTGRWLQTAPVDMIRWSVHNSHRLDLAPVPLTYVEDGAVRSDGLILPYEERRCDRWNTDQFRVDGGFGGWIEMDGADVLAPYWMARHLGFIVPAAPE